jgi:antitoxin MazE
MILTINKWGNSQGIRFPKELLKKLHANIGSSVNVEYEDGKVIIEPIVLPKKYNIHDLVKNIKAEDRPKEVNWGIAQGNEEW